MTPAHVLAALRSEQNVKTHRLAVEVWRHILGRIKPAGMRDRPISPVEEERVRGVCLTILAALDAAKQVAPSHFQEVPAPQSEPQTRGDTKHDGTTDD